VATGHGDADPDGDDRECDGHDEQRPAVESPGRRV
jgi:hypothetical protein